MATPFIIDDGTPDGDLLAPVVDGEHKARGYDPSFIDPVIKAEFRAMPSEIQVIPRSEWSARCKEQAEQKSSLYHLKMTTMADGKPHPSLDQNGQGYCWYYSLAASGMYARAAAHLPYVRFSPHAGACKVKNFRDQGGGGGLSAKHAREFGLVPEAFWPQKSMSRSHDTPATWAAAAKYKITEDYVDLTKNVYDQNLTVDQVATCLLLNIPVVLDFNWWGHSVCGIQWCEVEPGSFGPRIDNSWTPNWGEDGTSILRGGKGVPDGAVATRVIG
jgi:hypothetical protein